MSQYIANYMWNFKPSEKSPVPATCIDSNKNFFCETNILSPGDIEPLVKHYPRLEKLWGRIPHWIIKADLGRLLHIYFHGNFYFDIDCRIRKNIPLKSGNFLILFTEMIVKHVNKLGPRECKNPENVLRIANYAFGTNVIRHPFLEEVILECIERLAFLIDSDPSDLHQTDILWVCGPDVITSIYHKAGHRYPDLVLLDTSYLSHLCHGSWRE
ncbi:MAG TPA: glycosyltransferase [Arenimonas sp.]|nr:glycosyltransferase [Arenimonas sp.]HOZ05440.1 glycosyltransferase [Arenimonas sp.]HPO24573.1 glycosyltransferase [Arenimonas sp.]HPW31594.1 glycosyltransferase [Arenimonas sp.]